MLPRLLIALFLGQEVPQEEVVRFGTTVVISSGLRGDVYHLGRNTSHLPKFQNMKPVGTIYVTSLNIPPQHFEVGFPGVTKRIEWFAIDYTGRFWIERPETYTFSLLADDGAKLYVDEKLVIDNDGAHPPTELLGAIPLPKGVHSIRVSYFQGPRYEVALVLKIAAPGELLHIFNTNELKPPPDSTDLAQPPR